MVTNTFLSSLITSLNGPKLMCTFNNTADTATHFFFNHVISYFGVPLQLVSDHGKHFENEIFVELSSRLGFSHKFASPYYPQSNRQVEAVNKVLKTMLQCMVNKHKTNWHHMLFSVLWAYRTTDENCYWFHTIPFSPWGRGNSSHRVRNSHLTHRN
jgi:transposase InsO family protein